MNCRRILCYRDNKLVWTVDCILSDERFEEQLKDGILRFHSKDDYDAYEIIYLKNFDKVVVKNWYMEY